MNRDAYMELAAAERVYRATKDAIISGEYGPGTLLSANAMAELLGVSRTPAREAFVRLEGEGLLDLIPKRGAVVLPMSRTEARDVLDVRHALEVSAVSRLARMSGRERLLSEAMTALTAQQASVEADDLSVFPTQDENFHLGLIIASGNEVATRMYEMLRDRQLRMTHAAPLDRERMQQMLDQHRQLYELALVGDVQGFADAHWAHILGTHRALVGDELAVQQPELTTAPARLNEPRS